MSVAANGSFTYLPAVGFTGADSFTYTLRDDGIDGIAGNADDLTGTATVSITVANKVWYVDSTAAAGGTGTSALPFNTVTAFTTVNNGVGTTHPAAGDTVYVRERAGDYDGNVTLLNNQQLIGSGVDLIVGGFTLLTATGKTTMVTTVAATNAITLASGDTVRGFDIGNTTGAGIFGGNVGALTINTVGKTGTGKIIDLTGAAGNNVAVTLDTASTTNSATEGIKLTGIIGSFTATTGAISGVARWIPSVSSLPYRASTPSATSAPTPARRS